MVKVRYTFRDGSTHDVYPQIEALKAQHRRHTEWLWAIIRKQNEQLQELRKKKGGRPPKDEPPEGEVIERCIRLEQQMRSEPRRTGLTSERKVRARLRRDLAQAYRVSEKVAAGWVEKHLPKPEKTFLLKARNKS